jgi:hypothetical protein
MYDILFFLYIFLDYIGLDNILDSLDPKMFLLCFWSVISKRRVVSLSLNGVILFSAYQQRIFSGAPFN